MNDKHLFRGQRVDTKEWVYGYYAEVGHGLGQSGVSEEYGDVKSVIIVTQNKQSPLYSNAKPCEIITTEMFEVIPETVGEWATLKDKNGKLIFENDVVVPVYVNPLGEYNENDFDLTNKKIVAFKNGCFGFETATSFYPIDNYIPRKNGEYVCNHGNKLIYSDFVMMKVIGNIHQDSHLLGGK